MISLQMISLLPPCCAPATHPYTGEGMPAGTGGFAPAVPIGAMAGEEAAAAGEEPLLLSRFQGTPALPSEVVQLSNHSGHHARCYCCQLGAGEASGVSKVKEGIKEALGLSK